MKAPARTLLLAAIAYFGLVIVVAHLLVPASYRWPQHTISELAAQGLPRQAVMQAGFVGFGLLLAAALGTKTWQQKRILWPDGLLLLYATAVLLSGIYSTAPFLADVVYSVQESWLHSLFAQTAGFAFSVAILFYAWRASSGRRRWHVSFFVLVIGLSVTFGLSENGLIALGRGLIQRLLYTVSLTWLWWSQSQVALAPAIEE